VHTHVTGITESGKSTLVMHLMRDFRRQGHPTMALTAVEPDLAKWRSVCDYVTMDPDAFARVFWSPRTRGAMVAIDEGPEFIGRWDQTLKRCFTMGRHQGASVFAIGQRVTELNRTVRSQCRQAIAFQQDASDAAALVKDFGKKELHQVAQLPQYEYLVVQRFGEVRRGRVTPL
jgi:hypothetical protein